MELPKSMIKSKRLNDSASLQYENGAEELYVIVLDESKKSIHDVIASNGIQDLYSNDIEGYSKLIMDGLKTAIKKSKTTNLKKEIINSNKSITAELSATVDNLKVYYSLAYIEGKDTYYQIMSWTLSNKKELNKEKINKMIHSFKEIK